MSNFAFETKISMLGFKINVFLLFLILTSCLSESYSQKLSATVNRNKVGVGEQFQISYSINGNGSNFQAPSFNDFNFLGGPSQSTSMQIINGAFSQSVSFTYYLAGKKEGNFTIPAASINCEGKKLISNELKIEVVKGNAPQTNTQGQGQNRGNQRNSAGNTGGNTSANAEQEIRDNLFVKASVEKSKVYQGEAVLVTYKIYRRIDVTSYQVTSMPKYNNFWKEDLKTDNESYNENVDGIQYAVTTIKKTLLYPQRSGKLEIDPIELSCSVRLKTKRSNNIFDDFFGPAFGGYKDVNYEFKSNTAKIEVLPLPTGAPESFKGAVGRFSLDAKLDKEQIKANDAVNFKMSIQGKGNLKLIDPPKINLPDDLESYDPKTVDNFNIKADGVSGSRSFEYLIIPRNQGTFEIPSVEFTYFDLDSKKYKTLQSKSYNLNVEKGNGSSSASSPQVNTPNKSEVKVKLNDIRFINLNEKLSKEDDSLFFKSTLFYVLLLLPLLLFGSVLVFKKVSSTDGFVKTKLAKEANKISKLHLEKAKEYIQTDSKTFYHELQQGIHIYLSKRVDIANADFSNENIRNSLRLKNIAEEHVNELISIIDTCNFARYSPDLGASNRTELLTKCEIVIDSIEDNLAKAS